MKNLQWELGPNEDVVLWRWHLLFWVWFFLILWAFFFYKTDIIVQSYLEGKFITLSQLQRKQYRKDATLDINVIYQTKPQS